MFSKTLAAAVTGLCLICSAHAGSPLPQDPQSQAASPETVPEAVGGTNDVIVLEVGPSGAVDLGPDDMAALMLLQLLMMQSQMGAGGGDAQMDAPSGPTLIGI